MLKEIEIIGLFGEMDIKLPLTGKNSLSEGSDVVVLIGENGSGKTTVLNILNDLFNFTKKFNNLNALLSLIFDKIIVSTIDNKFIVTSSSLKEYKKLISLLVTTLNNNNDHNNLNQELFELLFYNNSSNINIDTLPESDKVIYLLISQKINLPLINKLLKDINKLSSSEALFFPTYRRIEKNISKSQEKENIFFGMTDINELIDKYIENIKDFSSKGYELMKEFIDLKDMSMIETIKGNIEKKTRVFIEILNNFANTCNKYLFRKKIIFIPEEFEWYIEKENKKRVTLDNLSSGEKQMLSIFAQLYLKDDKNLIILFDEPELSISVEWQRMLIPDMLKSNKIKQLVIATHSPSIFHDDELFKNTIDIHDCTTYRSVDNE